MHDGMNQEQIDRINEYLETVGSDIFSQPDRRVRQLIKIDNAIQSRLAKYSQIQDLRKEAAVNISVISEDTQISRKTFYNDDHFLGNYVERFTITEHEKNVSSEQYLQLKEKHAKLESEFKKMLLRDVDMAELQHSIIKLRNEVETLAKLRARYETELEKAKRENMALKEQFRQLRSTKIIEGVFPSFSPEPTQLREGSSTDTFNLGITYGSMDDLSSALSVADKCGTRTVMVYCDNEYFYIPKGFINSNYNVVVHGPVSTNIASPDEIKRSNSVKRLMTIISNLNRYKKRIHAFVIHPGSAMNDLYLVDSLKELLSKSEITIAVENMSGQGKQLLSTLEEMQKLYNAMQDYDKFTFCIDTCHLNDAGYDVNNAEQLVDLLAGSFPLSKISVIHLNDSKNPEGSRKDRHAVIGKGTIDVGALRYILKHPLFYEIPKVIESPQKEGELTFPTEIKLLLNSEG